MSFADQKVRPGRYLKIESDRPTELRILNDSPIETVTHRFGDEAKECAGEHCMECKSGDVPVQRFSTNVYSHDDQRVMIWKYPTSVHRQLVAIEKECTEASKTLQDVDLRVSASGTNKSKKYMVTMKMVSKSVPAGLSLYRLDLPF